MVAQDRHIRADLLPEFPCAFLAKKESDKAQWISIAFFAGLGLRSTILLCGKLEKGI